MEDALNDTFKIQLKIAGKNYPLICKRNEERYFRLAANLINDKLLRYGNKYQTSSLGMRDLLVMTACDIASSYQKVLDEQNDTPAYEKIEKLTAELEDFIQSEL